MFTTLLFTLTNIASFHRETMSFYSIKLGLFGYSLIFVSPVFLY